MEIQNNLLDKNIQKPVESFELSYASDKEKKGKLVRYVTDNSSYERAQHVYNKIPALNSTFNL